MKPRASDRLERRWIETDVRCETRDGEAQAPPRVVGYAAVWDSPSEPIEWLDAKGNLVRFRETIARGAFAASILDCDCRALFNHDPSLILGRNRAGTLRLTEDDHGLRYECDLPDVSYARDLAVSLRRGDITGSSFAFVVIADEWHDPEAGSDLAHRRITKAHLFDVSPVTYPAYQASSSAVRSIPMAIPEAGDDVPSFDRDFLELLRLRFSLD